MPTTLICKLHYIQCQHKLTDNEQYRRSVDDLPYPRGIAIVNPDGTYKVIDGYHRLAGAPEDEDPLLIYCVRD